MKNHQNAVNIALELRVHIARKYKTQTSAAIAWGCSKAFVSAVLKGKRAPNELMLSDAGFKRVEAATYYVKA